jgi:hypothetical protein
MNCEPERNIEMEVADIRRLLTHNCDFDTSVMLHKLLADRLIGLGHATPKLIFGKGDVKAQANRYRARVIAEKRFQCVLCEKVFTTNGTYKVHCEKRSCVKKEAAIYTCVPCGFSSTVKSQLVRHCTSAKHRKNCPAPIEAPAELLAPVPAEAPVEVPIAKPVEDEDRCDGCGYREYNCHCGSGYGKYW